MCTCQDLKLLRGQRYSRWRPAAILKNSFIHTIFIFHETEMKFGKHLLIQVLDDSVFANLSNYFKELAIQGPITTVFYRIFF